MTGRINIKHLTLAFGEGDGRSVVLDDVSLNVAPGEFVCLIGPSGCGKSTLLSALAGHLEASHGELYVDHKPVEGPHPERGLVFQQHTLFPWKRVLDNIAHGMKMQGIRRRVRHQQARALMAKVGLEGFERHYPAQLSGGMQQRVEIARVLINQPRVLLMDEPFGSLDAITRLKMQQLLLEIWQQIGTTVIFVTHDIDEALFLADRVVVMSHRPGRIIEEIAVGFARPRIADICTSAHFARLKQHCLALLHDDVDRVPRPAPTILFRPNVTPGDIHANVDQHIPIRCGYRRAQGTT